MSRPLWLAGRVEEYPVHLLACRRCLCDFPVIAIDGEDVAVWGDGKAERRFEELTG